MSLRESEYIVGSPLLRSSAAASLYPEDPLSSTKEISTNSKNSVLDHSVDDGTGASKTIYFQQQHDPERKPIDWTTSDPMVTNKVDPVSILSAKTFADFKKLFHTRLSKITGAV